MERVVYLSEWVTYSLDELLIREIRQATYSWWQVTIRGNGLLIHGNKLPMRENEFRTDIVERVSYPMELVAFSKNKSRFHWMDYVSAETSNSFLETNYLVFRTSTLTMGTSYVCMERGQLKRFTE